MPKKRKDERSLRFNGEIQEVYISGLSGIHTLETGIAYYYRGHYIYSVPGRVPIQPVTFSSTSGLTFAGIVGPDIPCYDDLALENQPEWRIGALTRSCDLAALEVRNFHEKNKKPTGADSNFRVNFPQYTAGASEESKIMAVPNFATPELLHYQRPSSNRIAPELLTSRDKWPLNSADESVRLSAASRPFHGLQVDISHAPPNAFQDQFDQIDAVRALNALKINANSLYETTTEHSVLPQVEVPDTADNTLGTAFNSLVPPSSHMHEAFHAVQNVAFSAPGSRFIPIINTPHDSRSATPFRGLDTPGGFLSVIGSSRPEQLRFQEGDGSSFSTAQVASQATTVPVAKLDDPHSIVNPKLTSKAKDINALELAHDRSYWEHLDADPIKFFSIPTGPIRKCRVPCGSSQEEELISNTPKLYGNPNDIEVFTGPLSSPRSQVTSHTHHNNSFVRGNNDDVARQVHQSPANTVWPQTETQRSLLLAQDPFLGLGHIRTNSRLCGISTLRVAPEQRKLGSGPGPRNIMGTMPTGADSMCGPFHESTDLLRQLNASTSIGPPATLIHERSDLNPVCLGSAASSIITANFKQLQKET